MEQMKIAELEKWFAENCNGDWEHQGGLKIGTLDNPGWMVRLDLDTIEHKFDETVSDLNRPLTDNPETTDEDFVHYRFFPEQNALEVACGVSNLSEVLAFILSDANYPHVDSDVDVLP